MTLILVGLVLTELRCNTLKASFFHIRALRHIRPSISRSILPGLRQFVVHRHVVGKLRQTTTYTKHARSRDHVNEEEALHFNYLQMDSLAFDQPTRRLQGVSAHIRNAACW